ncbi:Sulfur oxidation protein SoxX [Lutibaculum baratangense AMV1]|uniref:Sulfur oxidation protein SoxX n=1 Tax=Lutibaculum baratangense AMV1 TaxID=631454 RepID=V4RW72_9HYPH|nr:Sulfur oxidation protein SoxX [Lutibaculum baratangense AMV1]
MYAALAAVLLGTGPVTAGPVEPGNVEFAEDFTVSASLTDEAGDPAEGRKAFADRSLGNCLACHAVTEMSDQQFHGDVGPSLDGVAERYDPAFLRAIVVNAKHVFGEQTIMPGFYTLEVGVDVAEKHQGKTILSAQQVEDVVAYLTTLTD